MSAFLLYKNPDIHLTSGFLICEKMLLASGAHHREGANFCLFKGYEKCPFADMPCVD